MAHGSWRPAMAAMVCCSCASRVRGLARAVSRAHLAGRVFRARALRRQRRVHEQVVVLGGIGARRGERGGERGALHIPIVLTIVGESGAEKLRPISYENWLRYNMNYYQSTRIDVDIK